ncbi:Sec23/Sec24 zinc finger [Ancylostoma duodenale]|uniref:Sec23/Sec24 zinc finger n=1 Tax=Ancylostoma duodenale TaxID=51022 RepID=A0A0C2CS06_9BILA|nr:Sec23/Sec24 zinc finger [Ancylostoma duodenale]
MANPSNAIPPKVGFPQAFGNTPYQHASQFPQYAHPATAAQPQPSGVVRANPFQPPPAMTQFPSPPSLPQQSQAVNGLPQEFPSAQPHTGLNGPSSAFKPYGNPPVPAFPAKPAAFPQPPQRLDQHAPFQVAGAPPPINHSSSLNPTPTPNMNPVGAMPQPTHPAWGGSYQNDSRMAATPAYSSDLVDLMGERSILQSGFDDIEYSLPHNMANNQARVDPSVFRCTLTMVPQNEELLKKSRLPLGLTLHPFRDMKNLNIIQTSTIVRCRYCRTYINPYVYLPDSRHWKCNLCNRNNDLPDDFCWDPNTKSFGDPVNRPEIKHPTVEFIAPNEYMLRPPQPAVYVFVLDVSAAAIEAGVQMRACGMGEIVDYDTIVITEN